MTTHFVTSPVVDGEMPMRPDTQAHVALDRLRNRLTRKHIDLDLLDLLLSTVESVAYGLEQDLILDQHSDGHNPDRAMALAEVWWVRKRTWEMKPRVWDAKAFLEKTEEAA